MSTSELATLKVGAHDSVEVSVIDGTFGVVAEGTGDFEATLPPGIYEVQLRVGPTLQRRLVKLEAGTVHQERSQFAEPNAVPDAGTMQLALPSAAPVDGTSTTSEDHMAAAAQASELLQASGARGGIVLMVRNLRDSTARWNPTLVEGVSLVDEAFQPVEITYQTGPEWATAAAPLEPGGYALRVDPAAGSQEKPLFQSLYVAEDWQTLLFVANSEQGLVPERAAVHMTRMGDPWQPLSDRRDLDLAAEAARWSLRQGRGGLSPQLLLHSKFRNPMLGILGAHVLLLDPNPRFDDLDVVIRNLDELVPGHPDVRALTWMLQDVRRQNAEGSDVPQGPGIAWPPMLLASYTAAIRRDANEPGAIVDGSPAEALAAHVVVTAIWTSWRQPPGQTDEVTFGLPTPTASMDESDPSLARVLDYVDAVAARRKVSREAVLATADEKQCAIGSGLPTAVTRRALAQLREESG